jgi:hypothetical protein
MVNQAQLASTRPGKAAAGDGALATGRFTPQEPQCLVYRKSSKILWILDFFQRICVIFVICGCYRVRLRLSRALCVFVVNLGFVTPIPESGDNGRKAYGTKRSESIDPLRYRAHGRSKQDPGFHRSRNEHGIRHSRFQEPRRNMEQIRSFRFSLSKAHFRRRGPGEILGHECRVLPHHEKRCSESSGTWPSRHSKIRESSLPW